MTFTRGSPKFGLMQAAAMHKKLSPKYASQHKKRASPKMTSTQNKFSPKVNKQRAAWTSGLEKGLVELLHDHMDERGQNGWSTDSWNRMVRLFHEKFPYVSFTKTQMQDKERELKRDYNLLKEARNQSGASWNERLCRIEADSHLWDNIIMSYPKAKKFRNKSFPLFDALGEIHDGNTAEGTHNLTSIQPPPQDSVTQNVDDEEQYLEDDPFDTGLNAASMGEEDDSDEVREVDQLAATSSAATSTGRRVTNSRNRQHGGSQRVERSAQRRRQDGTIVEMMGSFLETRKKQVEVEAAELERTRANARSDEYPISACVLVVESMQDLSDDEKADAFDVSKDAHNRAIFMTAGDSTRLLWLKKKIAALSTLHSFISS